MPPQNGEPNSDDNYQSTDADKNRAKILGVTYILLAIFLAWMLFKIWPPTPWPTDKAIDQNPQLVKNLADCECPTPTVTPTPTPRQSTSSAATGPQPSGDNTSSTPTPTTTRTPQPKATVTKSQGGATDQTKAQNSTPTATPSPTPTPPVTTDTLVNLPINIFWGRWCWR